MTRLDAYGDDLEHPLYGAWVLGTEEARAGEHSEDLQAGVDAGLLYVCPVNDGSCRVVPGHIGGVNLHLVAGHTMAEYDALVDS